MAIHIIPRALLQSLLETVQGTENVDLLRQTTEWVVQPLLEADVSKQIGAGKHERAVGRRKTQRNGYRGWSLKTRGGHCRFANPKTKKGLVLSGMALLDRKRRRGVATMPGAFSATSCRTPPRSPQPEITNMVRSILQQPSHELAGAQLKRIVREPETRLSKAAHIVELASPDLLAHMHFLTSHWRRRRSTNPLERLNREIRRRSDVVGLFPNRTSTVWLLGAVLLEQHEEWMAGTRYFTEQAMQELYELQVPDSEI